MRNRTDADMNLKQILTNSLPRSRQGCQHLALRRKQGFQNDVKRCTGQNHSPIFLGLVGEDWWYWANHARFMMSQGTYIDLAANDPVIISNSFFLDACLGWRGLCIEPNPSHVKDLAVHRSCSVVPKCIAETKSTLSMVKVNDPTMGRSHLGNVTNKDIRRGYTIMSVPCDTFANTVAVHGITHVDFLSLDVERHESGVLAGINWDAITIDVIIMESDFNSSSARTLLSRGYERIDYLGRPCRGQSAYVNRLGGFKLGIERVGGVLLPAAAFWNEALCEATSEAV